MVELELRTFYYSSGETDTPGGDICSECFGMRLIAMPGLTAFSIKPCEHCKGTGLEPAKAVRHRAKGCSEPVKSHQTVRSLNLAVTPSMPSEITKTRGKSEGGWEWLN